MTTIEVAEETEATDEAEAGEASSRSQMDKHEAFVAWYEENYEIDLNECDAPTIIAEFARFRNEFRRSEMYLERWGPEAREKLREEREAERERQRNEREAARAAKLAEKQRLAEEAEKAKENGEGETKPKPAAKRAVKRTAVKRAAVKRAAKKVDNTADAEESSDEEVFD